MDNGQLPPQPQPSRKARAYYVSGALAIIILLGGVGFLVLDRRAAAPRGQAESATTASSTIGTATTTIIETSAPAPVIAHVPLPDEVRGIYWTAWTAGSKRADILLAYASSSHLNTIVIDLKLDGGELAFVPRDPVLSELVPKDPAVKDLDALLARLKNQNIYRIARIAVMRDRAFGELHPEVALRYAGGGVWRDKTGMQWLDPAAPEVGDYALALAHEAYARGFDEIQFDYVRFASDGALTAIRYPVYDGKLTKSEVMRKFFERVGGTLQAEKIPVSFDLFGLTCCAVDDLGIGQRLSDVIPFSDYVSQMAYPSHYAHGFEGLANPALYPYEVVKKTLDRNIATLHTSSSTAEIVAIRQKSRPWIQDFNIGAIYDASKVQAQIKAVRDSGASGWMIWNAANRYTTVKYAK
ncbi:MAG: putative glycoside hydrolase [Patescibacteria group bacterium]